MEVEARRPPWDSIRPGPINSLAFTRRWVSVRVPVEYRTCSLAATGKGSQKTATDYPPSTTRRHVENQPPNLTKHQILQPQYLKGSGAPFIYAYDRNGLEYSIFLPDNSLRFPRLTSTRLRGGTGGKDMIKYTTSQNESNGQLPSFTNPLEPGNSIWSNSMQYNLTSLYHTTTTIPPIAQNVPSKTRYVLRITQPAWVLADNYFK